MNTFWSGLMVPQPVGVGGGGVGGGGGGLATGTTCEITNVCPGFVIVNCTVYVAADV
ncbi:MAG TPA: hypothetical protein VGA33_10085 [Thermoanaerobaculia bacterium]